MILIFFFLIHHHIVSTQSHGGGIKPTFPRPQSRQAHPESWQDRMIPFNKPLFLVRVDLLALQLQQHQHRLTLLSSRHISLTVILNTDPYLAITCRCLISSLFHFSGLSPLSNFIFFFSVSRRWFLNSHFCVALTPRLPTI